MTLLSTIFSAQSEIPLPKKPFSIKQLYENTGDWLSSHLVELLIATAAGIIIYLVLALVKRTLAKLRSKASDPTDFKSLVGRTAARTTHIFMILAAARLVVGYADPPEFLIHTVRFLFTVSAVFQGALWAREFILGLIERKTGDNGHGETLSNAMGLIRVLISVAVFAIAAVMILDNLGVNVTGLVAGLGIGGIAIGLAAQGIFSDLFAALSIIFDKPFRQGDTIMYGTTVATVEHIGLKSTRLRSVEGEAKVISNANLLEMEITNYADIQRRRYAMPVGVIYQTAPEKAARIPEILEDVINGNGGEFVRAGFSGFGASSLDYECYFYVNEADLNTCVAIRHKIGIAMLDRFAQEGLDFAYPSQTNFLAGPDGAAINPFPRSEQG